jgi:glycosyltransferase involved in cell wall biosynthesis
MIDAFLAGARALGRTPHAISPGFVPALDGPHQAWAAHRIGRVARAAKSLWVVAAVSPYGAGAARARRPYACWIATSLADEWPSRVHELSAARRISHELNAPFLSRLERETLTAASAVYAISPASRDALKHASGREDVGILPLPVDVARFAPEPDDRWTARLDSPTVMFLGRADDPRKNVRLLLDAWPAIREAVPAARLVLVGRPPAVPLPEGADALGELVDVAAELRTAALLALPSLQEGFGLVAAEALACGVPVLSTPSGGPEELIRASGGGVTAGFDVQEFADTAITLLQNPDQLLAMRGRGRPYVEREHSPEVFRQRLAELLERHS